MQSEVVNLAKDARVCEVDKSNVDNCLNHTQSCWQMGMEDLENWAIRGKIKENDDGIVSHQKCLKSQLMKRAFGKKIKSQTLLLFLCL